MGTRDLARNEGSKINFGHQMWWGQNLCWPSQTECKWYQEGLYLNGIQDSGLRTQAADLRGQTSKPISKSPKLSHTPCPEPGCSRDRRWRTETLAHSSRHGMEQRFNEQDCATRWWMNFSNPCRARLMSKYPPPAPDARWPSWNSKMLKAWLIFSKHMTTRPRQKSMKSRFIAIQTRHAWSEPEIMPWESFGRTLLTKLGPHQDRFARNYHRGIIWVDQCACCGMEQWPRKIRLSSSTVRSMGWISKFVRMSCEQSGRNWWKPRDSRRGSPPRHVQILFPLVRVTNHDCGWTHLRLQLGMFAHFGHMKVFGPNVRCTILLLVNWTASSWPKLGSVRLDKAFY